MVFWYSWFLCILVQCQEYDGRQNVGGSKRDEMMMRIDDYRERRGRIIINLICCP